MFIYSFYYLVASVEIDLQFILEYQWVGATEKITFLW